MKILYVTTVSNTVNAFLIPHIEMLVNSGHRVDVAFAIDQGVDPKIYEMGCKVFEIPFQRSPFKAKKASPASAWRESVKIRLISPCGACPLNQ